MQYEIASATHIGHVRKTNQDRLLACHADKGDRQTMLAAVADGMGGLQDGEKASGTVVSLLRQWWDAFDGADTDEAAEELDTVIYEAHRQIYYDAADHGRRSGSTLSLLFLQGKQGFLKQIGDSRIYEIRAGAVKQLTVDQNWYNHVTASGKFTPEQAAKNRLSHMLVNALGASDELDIETTELQVLGGAAYLLCSDGFYHTAPIGELPALLKGKTVQEALEYQMRAVLAGTAGDNTSAVLCRIHGI